MQQFGFEVYVARSPHWVKPEYPLMGNVKDSNTGEQLLFPMENADRDLDIVLSSVWRGIETEYPAGVEALRYILMRCSV